VCVQDVCSDLHVLGTADSCLALLPAALQSPLQALDGVHQALLGPLSTPLSPHLNAKRLDAYVCWEQVYLNAGKRYIEVCNDNRWLTKSQKRAICRMLHVQGIILTCNVPIANCYQSTTTQQQAAD